MKYLKLAFISFLFLFIVVTGISLFIPSRIRISKAVNLAAANNSVMSLISDPAAWKSWYPGLDSAEQLSGTGGVIGYRIGQRATLLLTSKTSSEVNAEFSGGQMKPVLNVWKTTVHPGVDSLTLQWYMDFRLRWYPWEKFASLLLEKTYGPRMENGLATLKKHAEN